MIATALILWILAAIFNSVMDSLYDHRINRTIFGKLNPAFWNKDYSWQYGKMIFKYRIDGWHLTKSSMILCLAGSCISFLYCNYPVNLWHLPIVYVALGILWNGTFNLFYNHIWLIKKK